MNSNLLFQEVKDDRQSLLYLMNQGEKKEKNEYIRI